MNTTKLVNTILDGFQKNKGRASFYLNSNTAVNVIVVNTILKFTAKHKGQQILIVVDCWETRQSIKKALGANSITEENGYDIKILSEDYVKITYGYPQKLIITVGVNTNVNLIKHLVTNSNYHNGFVMAIFTKPIMEHKIRFDVHSLLRNIATDEFCSTISEVYVYSPVEERRVDIKLDNSDILKYNQYTDYINKCVTIFGNTGIIEKCKYGDKEHNISAQEFRYNLAVSNGWNEHLDTSIEFQKQIDDIYNPNSLNEYAHNFYSFTRLRRDFVTDYEGKFPEILKIVEENRNKQILIVSARGEYAAKVTEYINTHSNIVECGDYHDCLDMKAAYDEYGEPILIKSGKDKGKHKMIGAQAQSTLNEKRFKLKSINCLSIKNASDTKLNIACDLVIFTSPMAGSIADLKLRFHKSDILRHEQIYYILYCDETIEQVKLDKDVDIKLKKTITYINEKNIGYDENSGDVIL